MLTIGTHMSIAKGLAKTAENVVWMGANTIQPESKGIEFQSIHRRRGGKVPEDS